MARNGRISGERAHDCVHCPTRLEKVASGLPAREATDLAALAVDISAPSQRSICREGDSADFVFQVTAGVARLSKLTRDGRRQVLRFALPGDFFGFTVENVYTYSVDAVKSVDARKFKRKAFDAFVASRPPMMSYVNRALCHELKAAHELATSLGRRRADERVAAFLIEFRDRVGCGCHDDAPLHMPLAGRDIGDYLGLSTETVSRTLHRFQDDGILSLVPDGVRIHDSARIAELAGHSGRAGQGEPAADKAAAS
jgi:CRP/FNR family transcriptional regulator, anaerobic regulatory protein